MPVCMRGTDEEVRMITEFIIQRAPSGKLMQHNEEMRMLTEFTMQIAPFRKLMQCNEEMRMIRRYHTESTLQEVDRSI